MLVQEGIDDMVVANPLTEALARAIAGQQLSGAVAKTILGRFTALYPGGEYPTPQQLLDTPDDTLRAVGFSWAKIAALKDLAAKTLSGVVPAAEELAALDDEAIIERLVQVRGIGRWSAQMLLMFQLGRLDIWPTGDYGVRNGYSKMYGLPEMLTPKLLQAEGEKFHPYRSIVACWCWRAATTPRR